MTPNVADFTVIHENDGTPTLECPICFPTEFSKPLPYRFTIRDLIAAASEHSRSEHPLSAPATIKGA